MILGTVANLLFICISVFLIHPKIKEIRSYATSYVYSKHNNILKNVYQAVWRMCPN